MVTGHKMVTIVLEKSHLKMKDSGVSRIFRETQ